MREEEERKEENNDGSGRAWRGMSNGGGL